MRRNLILLVAAIVVGAVAAVAAFGYLRSARTDIVSENQPVQVLVAQQDLPQGMSAEEMISKEYAKLEEVPDRFVPADGLSSTRPIENMVLAVPVSAGEQLTVSRFTFPNEAGLSYTVPDDLVATSVAVNEAGGVSGLLRPGDTVMVFATFNVENAGAPDFTQTIVERARVLAVGRNLSQVTDSAEPASDGGMLDSRSSDSAAYQTVTLAVTPAQAGRIAYAHKFGDFQLALISQTAPDQAAPGNIIIEGSATKTPAIKEQ